MSNPGRPQKVEPENWSLETTSQDDPTLPHPRGTSKKDKPVNHAEELHLKLTRQNGGLVKEEWEWIKVGGKMVPIFSRYVVDKE
jgi:hypothetical protein